MTAPRKPREPKTPKAVFRHVRGAWAIASNVPLTPGTRTTVLRGGAYPVVVTVGEPVPDAWRPKGTKYWYWVEDRTILLVVGKHPPVVLSRHPLAPWSVVEARKGCSYQPVEIGEEMASHLIPPGYTHGYWVDDLDPDLPAGSRAPTPVPVPLSITTDNHLGFAAEN